MKRIKTLFSLLIITLLIIPIAVNAEDATFKITTNAKNFSAGNTIEVKVSLTSSTAIGYYEYTLDYNTKKLQLLNSNSYIVDSPNNNSTKKIEKKFKFKIKKEGNNKIDIKSYSVTSFKGSKNLSVKVTPLELGKNSSTNTSEIYLKELKIEGATLKEEFNKDKTEYTATLDNNSKTIKITAKANKDSYEIKGTGEFEVSTKENSFEITVSDDDDNSKTYTINIKDGDTKNEKITINGKEYILISDANSYKDIPNGFEPKKIEINKKDIIALYNKKTNQTLVVLKNEDGELELFLYDEKDDSYKKYEVITFEKLSIIPIETNKTIKGYEKDKITINEKEINCLKLGNPTDFALIYGMDAENGEEGWYSYDIINGTLQKYNSEIANYYNEKEKNTRILIYILAGTSIFFGILVIVLAAKLSNKKRRY